MTQSIEELIKGNGTLSMTNLKSMGNFLIAFDKKSKHYELSRRYQHTGESS